MTINYGFGKTLTTDFDTAIDKVTEALKTEGFGVLLPCNVVVRETDGGVRVEFMDPSAVLGMVDSDDVAVLAAEVRGRLERVRDSL